MPFIHSQRETYRGLRSVRSTLQESDPLIYRPLIRLPLWRFEQANDENSPSFCVCLLSASSPPPQQTPHQYSIPHWPPSSPHPALKLWCSSWVSTHLPYIGAGASPLFYLLLFELRAHCRLNTSWRVSLLSLPTLLLYLRPVLCFCFYTEFIISVLCEVISV